MTYKEVEKAAKFIARQDQVITRKDGDSVLISDGHFIVKVYDDLYNTAFRPVSFRFPELQEGQTMTSPSKKALPEPCNMDLRKCIPQEEGQELTVTPFIEELTNRAITRVFLTGDNIMVNIDEDYYKNLNVFNTTGQWTGEPKKPVCSSDLKYEDMGVLILPINTGSRTLEIRA